MSSEESSSQTRLVQSQLSPSQQQQQQQGFDTNGQVSLTLRLLMLGKEVGGIIGKKGDNIKRFREESGAKINISDGSCPERIVTISGLVPDVFKAFSMICKKFEENQAAIASGQPAMLQQQSHSSTKSSSNVLESNNGNVDGNNSATPMDTQPSMFPNSGLLSESKLIDSFSKKGSEALTINNNNTSTLDNNNLSTLVNSKDELLSPHSSSATANGSNVSGALQITMRLIIPASQCGSLIGRGGARIKELRDLTGATIQVAADVLPNSTERVVTTIGNFESLVRCAYHICNIMVDCPPKGYTIPYLPKPTSNPINPLVFAAMAASQATAAYNLPGQYAVSHPPDINRLLTSTTFSNAFNPAVMASTLRSIYTDTTPGITNLSRVAGTHEMVIPNGLIGCVIGKGGSKINEIRQISGANIKISSSEGSDKDRTVTINGTPEAINLAQYLITITII